MRNQQFAKRWFFATGMAVTPVKNDAGIIVPKITDDLYKMLMEHTIHEYQWAEVTPGGAIDGWFQPTNVHAADTISQLLGVTLLPSLLDSTPASADLVKLLAHAGITPSDGGYGIIKKLCDYHHNDSKNAYRHPGLRPELY